MHFAVFAIASVPDVATARRLFALDDLDDKSVAKVLFHQRKQQTGSDESLRWDQRAIAGISLIQHAVDDLQIETLNLPDQDERAMLEAYCRLAQRNGCMVSWDAARTDLPLIRFRSLMHGLSCPAHRQAPPQGPDLQRVICDWLTPYAADRPGLDETARRLGYPGLLQHRDETLHRAWLQRRHDEFRTHSELAALNSYLLALRLFTTTGEMPADEGGRALERLRDVLSRRDGAHLRQFLSAWGGA
jgi:predicted PolB exonuclease-like 3'-5' exonuclease